jgi:hypothetical protein
MISDSPMPFVEALKHLLAKEAMPSGMTSADWQQVDAGVRRQALFSAQTTMESYLDDIRNSVANIINPPTEPGAALNPASARSLLRELLVNNYGYRPEEGKEGTLVDLSSDKRLSLVIKTNVELAQGAGKFVQGNLNEDVIDLYPAWELVRYEDKKEPRDWKQRWRIAAATAGDARAAGALGNGGRMVALKSSGIWQALGDGAGGYLDTLGNPYPPFAFNSGMWTDDVSRDDAVELGLIGEGEKAEGAEFDFTTLFKAAA